MTHSLQKSILFALKSNFWTMRREVIDIELRRNRQRSKESAHDSDMDSVMLRGEAGRDSFVSWQVDMQHRCPPMSAGTSPGIS